MKREVTRSSQNFNCTRVISQPGDWTRYDYIFTKDGPDEYVFMPYGNNFNYPQRINYYTVAGIKLPDYREKGEMPKEIIGISNKYDCNPWTVVECIRTILKDHPNATGKKNG